MERKTLIEKLELSKPGLAKKDYIPVLTHFAFKGDRIITHNDIIAMETPLETGIEGCVRGKELIEFLKKSKSSDVELEQDSNDSVILKSGKSRATFPVLDIEKFYFDFPEEGGTAYQLDEDFFVGLKSALNSTSTEVHQRAMNGITLNGSNIYSTDNVVITEYELSELRFGSENKPLNLIFPLEFCRTINQLHSKYNELPTMSFGENHAVVDFSFCRVFTKLVEADPLDFSEIIEGQVKTAEKYTDIPENFKDAISRAALFVPDDGNCLLSASGQKLTIQSSSASSGEFNETCDIEDVGEIEVKTNPHLLLKVLGDATSLAITEFCLVLEGEAVTHLVANQ